MNSLKAVFGIVTMSMCLSAVSNAVYADSNVHVFTKMDAKIASMWQQRDDIRASLTKVGLIDTHGAHILHDHANDHGVGGDSDVDDIDVLASNDLLADKISELTENKSEHTTQHADNTPKTAFDSAHDQSDLSSAITVSKTEVIEPQRSSGKLLGVRPVKNAKVTSKYGYRRIFGRSQFHKGVDLAAKYGSPIYATGSGKVVYAGWMRGYGRFIEIDHENGYKTRYAHSARLRVKLGDRVSESQHIADLGCSGRCTGPHLHYEVKKNGKHMNPAVFLAIAPAG